LVFAACDGEDGDGKGKDRPPVRPMWLAGLAFCGIGNLGCGSRAIENACDVKRSSAVAIGLGVAIFRPANTCGTARLHGL